MIKQIANMMIRYHVIDKSNQEIYEYGIFVILFNGLCLLGILGIGLLLNDISYSFYFLITFIPIRILLGGFHCQSPYTCFIFFQLVFFSLYLGTHLIPQKWIQIIGTLLILISLILHYKDNVKYTILLSMIVIFFLVLGYIHCISLFYISSAFIMCSFLYFLSRVRTCFSRIKKSFDEVQAKKT